MRIMHRPYTRNVQSLVHWFSIFKCTCIIGDLDKIYIYDILSGFSGNSAAGDEKISFWEILV